MELCAAFSLALASFSISIWSLTVYPPLEDPSRVVLLILCTYATLLAVCVGCSR